jgi:hypothetical protein
VKRILLSLVMILGLILSPTPFALAVTDGCPNTWKIDSSKSGSQELLDAKLRLGSDMALKVGTLQYTNYSGESGPAKEPIGGQLTYSDLYLYGNTKVSQPYMVQVKNCPGSTSFVFNLGTLKESLSANSILVNGNSKEWATTNQSLFSDFLQAGKFSDCLENKKLQIQKPGYTQHQFSGNRLDIHNYKDFNLYMQSGTCGFRSYGLVLVDKTPFCRLVSPIDIKPSGRVGISIVMGERCDFSYAYLDEVGKTLTMFETFTIDSNNWRTSITCIKGTSKKVIQGLFGRALKCPAGYRKK